MRRIIKYKVIAERAKQLKEQNEILRQQQIELNQEIQNIKEMYQGIDSEGIIEKYTNKINDLDQFRDVIDNYIIYFEGLAGNTGTIHNKARRAIQKAVDLEEEPLLTTTLNPELLEENNVINEEKSAGEIDTNEFTI